MFLIRDFDSMANKIIMVMIFFTAISVLFYSFNFLKYVLAYILFCIGILILFKK